MSIPNRYITIFASRRVLGFRLLYTVHDVVGICKLDSLVLDNCLIGFRPVRSHHVSNINIFLSKSSSMHIQ